MNSGDLERLNERIDRMETSSMKWEDGPDILPFWVADMDLAVSPAIEAAVKKRADSPIYGYTDIPEEWYAAYQSWFEKRHSWKFQKEDLIYTNGVICALSSLVRRFSVVHEKVIVMTPVYSMFFNSIVNNGREVLPVELRYENGEYSIDFERLEQAMKDPLASLMIVCNPHNPTGNLWSKEELEKIASLAIANGVLVISDEVHCDLVRPGYEYVPFALASKEAAANSLTLLSPSKAFNIAGIHTAAVVSANPVLRFRAWRAINTDEVGEPNVFSIPAAVAAYTQSGQWLDSVDEYLFENRACAQKLIEQDIPGLKCIRSNALYLMWIDVSRICKDSSELASFLKKHAKIRVSPGSEFAGNGNSFIRINLACPRSMLLEGLKRLKDGIRLWTEQH